MYIKDKITTTTLREEFIMKQKKTHKISKRILLVTVSIAAVFFLVIMPILTILVYEDNFGERFETADWMAS